MALPTTTPTPPEPIDGQWLTGWSSNSRVIAWLPQAGWMEAGLDRQDQVRPA